MVLAVLTEEQRARITFIRYLTSKGIKETGYQFYNAEHDKMSKCSNPTDAYTRSLKHNPATLARPQGMPSSEGAMLAYNTEQARRKAEAQTLPAVAGAGVNENKPLNGVGSQGKSAQGKSPSRASPLGATSPGLRSALGNIFSNVKMSPSGGGDDGCVKTPERRLSTSSRFLESLGTLSKMVRKIDRDQDEQHRQTLAAREKEEAAREAAAAAHKAAAAHRSLVEAEIAVKAAARTEKVRAQRAEAKAAAQAAQDKAAAELAALQDSMVKRDGLAAAGLATPGAERTAE